MCGVSLTNMHTNWVRHYIFNCIQHFFGFDSNIRKLILNLLEIYKTVMF